MLQTFRKGRAAPAQAFGEMFDQRDRAMPSYNPYHGIDSPNVHPLMRGIRSIWTSNKQTGPEAALTRVLQGLPDS